MAREKETVRSGTGEGRAARSEPEAARGGLGEWVRLVTMTVVLFLVLRTFILQSFYISSGSMEPTLLVGDVLMVNKAAYGARIPGTAVHLPGWDEPSRNEIVVFRPEHDPGTDVVKRLVGEPGDTLAMRDRVLYRNGSPVEEPYAKHEAPLAENETHPWMAWQYGALAAGVEPDAYTPSRDDWGPIVVPEGSYFVMGDNRERSLDSRFWGFLERWRIRGKVSFIYYSFDPGSTAFMPLVTAMRPGRIGLMPGP